MTDRSGGRIITFYSYKGGTGRSMAVANAAWVLASNGLRVLMVDWDLEAPGLHRYFHPFLIDKRLKASPGIVDLVWGFSNAVMSRPDNENSRQDWYREYADLRDYTISLDWEFDRQGTLDLIPAGTQDASYASRVNSFDWENFYNRLGGGVFLEAVREDMRSRYDYVLIDSRTGVSDTSGICTVHMPDQLAVCFTLNTQSIEGASAVAKSVAGQRNDGIRIFPVPMRVEDGEKTKLERARDLAKEKFSSALNWLGQNEWQRYWGSVQVPYKVFYAYEEVLATFADTPMQTDSVLNAVEALTSYLVGTEMHLRPPIDELRHKVLEQFERKGGPPPLRSKETKPSYRIFLSHAHEDEKFARALSDLVSVLFEKLVVVSKSSMPAIKISPDGTDYQKWIKGQIESCDVMVIVLGGRQGELTPWMSQEVGMAVAYNKQLITVNFGGGYENTPAILSKFQSVSGSDPKDMLRILEHLNRELSLYPDSVFIRAAEPLLSDYLKKIESLVNYSSL